MKTIALNSLAFSLALLIAGTSTAAIPPLSLAELRAQADVIVTGKVTDVKVETLDFDSGNSNGSFQNSRYIITIDVQSVQKGPNVETLVVETWRPKSRPQGFVGPQGQNYIPAKGDTARFHCTTAEGGDSRITALDPNGILKFGRPGKGKQKPK